MSRDGLAVPHPYDELMGACRHAHEGLRFDAQTGVTWSPRLMECFSARIARFLVLSLSQHEAIVVCDTVLFVSLWIGNVVPPNVTAFIYTLLGSLPGMRYSRYEVDVFVRTRIEENTSPASKWGLLWVDGAEFPIICNKRYRRFLAVLQQSSQHKECPVRELVRLPGWLSPVPGVRDVHRRERVFN